MQFHVRKCFMVQIYLADLFSRVSPHPVYWSGSWFKIKSLFRGLESSAEKILYTVSYKVLVYTDLESKQIKGSSVPCRCDFQTIFLGLSCRPLYTMLQNLAGFLKAPIPVESFFFGFFFLWVLVAEVASQAVLTWLIFGWVERTGACPSCVAWYIATGLWHCARR